MKNRLILILALVHFIFPSFAQQTLTANYASGNIAEALKKDANAVYRLDEGELEVLSPSKYTLQVHQIVTVLNEEGASHLSQAIWFDKFNSVADVEVKVYNSAGIEVQKYKKKDFAVQNYYDGISLATDDKMMHLRPAAPEYPCTVELSYTRAASGYIDLPDWFMNTAASSVELFKYSVKVPSELDIRYKSVNTDLQPTIEDNGKVKRYSWEAQNVAVKKIEAGGYEGARYLPGIQVCPNVFEYDGYKGKFTSWSDFGRWCYPLYEEKGSFTAQRAAEIKMLVKDLPDQESKIRVLYDYLKKNMRYVSIQFGIGGYKPFTAKFVDEKKYGDCKALTNYMRCLLAEAGIKAYPALINAGYNKFPVNPGFPKNVFNHVILCVPGEKDSTWLECTSTKSAAGFLGSFTENKNALLLTENGGVLVSTPKSNYNNNVLTTVNDVVVNETGGAEVTSNMSGTGGFYSLLDEVSQIEGDKQNELFVTNLHYKEPDEFQLLKQNQYNENGKLQFHSVYHKLFDFKAGDKLFFPFSVQQICTERLVRQKSRKEEYVFDFPYKKVDTTIFHLPAGFKLENPPTARELQNDFVSYKREATYDAASNTLKIISNLHLKANIISPQHYEAVSDLFYLIEKEEGNKFILQKG